MDEWLFERRRTGEEDRGYNDRNFDVDDADPAVARLFQEAIERQVNEQQAVTRLVEGVESGIATVNTRIDELQRRIESGLLPTAERLAAVENSLRAVHESATTQGVAARDEVRDLSSRLLQEVSARFTALAEEVDRLRTSNTDHNVRIVQLAQSSEETVRQLEQRQQQLAAGVAELQTRLASASAQISGVGESMAPQLARLQAALADTDDALRVALDERVGRVSEQLALQLEGLGDETRRQVEALLAKTEQLHTNAVAQARTLGGLADATGATAHAIRDGLAEIGDRASTGAVEGVRPALDEFRQQLATEQRQALDATVAKVAESTGALDVRVSEAAGLVHALNATRAHDDQRLATFRAELTTALDAAVHASFSGFQSSLDERLTVQEQRLTRIRESIGSRVDDVVAELDRRLVEVGATVAEVDATLQGRLPALLDSRLAEMTAVVDERMPALLEGRLGDLAAAVDERLPELLDQRLSAIQAVVEQQLPALLEARIDVIQNAVEATLPNLLDEHLGEVRSAVDDRLPALLEARLNEVVAALDERLPETLAGSFAELRGALDERMTEVTGALEDTIPAGIDARLAEVAAALDERLPALLDARLAEVAEALDERLPALLDARLADVAAALDERLPANLEDHRNELNRAVATSLEAARERFARATDELRGVSSELVLLPGQLDARTAATVERASAAARAEAQTATVDLRLAISRLQDVSTRVGHLEQSLVAYLEARDLRMEEERTRVLADVLENFGGGMTRRERRRMSGRIGEAVDRSRLDTPPPILAPPPAAPAALPPVPTSAPAPAPAQGMPTVVPRREPDAAADAQFATFMEDDEVIVPAPRSRATPAPAPPAKTPAPRRTAAKATAPGPAPAPPATTRRSATKATAPAPTATPPPAPAGASLVCPVCGFVAKTPAGLASHRRVHA